MNMHLLRLFFLGDLRHLKNSLLPDSKEQWLHKEKTYNNWFPQNYYGCNAETIVSWKDIKYILDHNGTFHPNLQFTVDTCEIKDSSK